MKIMKQLVALTAAMAMCMTTVSTSVSAKSLYSVHEGYYNETQTEEIVTEEEIPVEEAIPAEEEAVPAEEEAVQEETVPTDEMPEEAPQEEDAAPAQEEVPSGEAPAEDEKKPDTIVEGIPVYFDYEGEGTFNVSGAIENSNMVLTVVAKPTENYSLEGGSLKFSSDASDVHKYDKNDFSTMYIVRYDRGSTAPITIKAKFIFVGTYYPITVQMNEPHGKPKAFVDGFEVDKAYAGKNVAVNLQTIDLGYKISEFHVLKSDGTEVPVRYDDRYGPMYGFTMPNDSVTLNVSYAQTALHNINVTVGNNIQKYHVRAGGGYKESRQAGEGDPVVVSCTEDREYLYKSVISVVNAETGEPLEMKNYHYVMPDADINVSIQVRHRIKLIQDDKIESVKFIISGSEGSEALVDEEVTVVAGAINNYRVGTITATDSAGNEIEVNQEKRTFTMPDRDVTVRAKPAISYVDENGEQHYQEEFSFIRDVQEGMGYGLSNGWYVLDKDVTFNEHRMTIVGDVNLILCDGATLNVAKGIRCGSDYNGGNNSLTIWGQQDQSGAIVCKDDIDRNNAAIGGNDKESAGIINIRGGNHGNGGTINIYGGDVTATGANWGAGIGGGNCGTGGLINIHGGYVTAYGNKGGAGIGGGDEANGGIINISAGDINATGGDCGAGIGGGDGADGGIINIEGGQCIIAHGGDDGGAGIGGGSGGDGGTITIKGCATVNARSGVNEYFVDNLNFGVEFIATHSMGAGIGGGNNGDGGTIRIYGGNICARGGSKDNSGAGAGIGGGDDGNGGNIYIYGGNISAFGGRYIDAINRYSAAAIGGGDDGDSGHIEIHGGHIEALAHEAIVRGTRYVDYWGDDCVYGAGIGAGDDGDEEYIYIGGGEVNATGYQAVGCGEDGDNGTLVFGDRIAARGDDIIYWNNPYNAARLEKATFFTK